MNLQLGNGLSTISHCNLIQPLWPFTSGIQSTGKYIHYIKTVMLERVYKGGFVGFNQQAEEHSVIYDYIF